MCLGLNFKSSCFMYCRGGYVTVGILLPTVFAIFLITVAVFNPSSCHLLQFHLSYVPVLRLCQLM